MSWFSSEEPVKTFTEEEVEQLLDRAHQRWMQEVEDDEECEELRPYERFQVEFRLFKSQYTIDCEEALLDAVKRIAELETELSFYQRYIETSKKAAVFEAERNYFRDKYDVSVNRQGHNETFDGRIDGTPDTVDRGNNNRFKSPDGMSKKDKMKYAVECNIAGWTNEEISAEFGGHPTPATVGKYIAEAKKHCSVSTLEDGTSLVHWKSGWN